MAKPQESNQALDDMELVRTRYDRARDCSDEPYDLARDDIKFVTVPGSQWDARQRAARGNRPMFEFPKLAGHCRQVVNEMRQTRPQGKVRGVGEEDRGLAEIMQGLARNIESVSNAELAYDIAYEAAVQGGFGCWRICTDYANDDDFEQDIRIKPIRNPFSVKFDPAANEIDRRDGRFTFVEETIAKDEFERRWPDAALTDFFENRACERWREGRDKVRIAEYWWKEPVKRELWAITRGPGRDAEIVWADKLGIARENLVVQGITLVRARMVDTHKVFMRMTNGHEWLTERYEFPSKFIPIIPVWGNIQNIDGEDYWQGMVRPAKDQQRLHNSHKTAAIEAVAKAPKAPFILKLSWIKGLERFWNRANAEDFPYLPLRDDAPDGAMPQRTQQAEVPSALLQLAAMDNDDIKASTGQFNPSLGMQSNATSGKAINSLKMQGSTATYNYIDNLVYAIRYQYEILVDMIPNVYDTPRVVRLLGPDGGEKWKQLYQEVVDPETGQRTRVNDISKGKYDVVVTVGPAYATQRMEVAENFMQLLGQLGPAVPQLAPLFAYQVATNLDGPGTEEVSTALRKQLVQMGILPPREGEEPPQQQEPNPQVMAQLRAILAKAMKDEADARKTEAETATVLPTAQADIASTEAKTVDQQLQNLLAGQGALFAWPPPVPPGINSAPIQPPQGGFSFGADVGAQPPQFTG